MAIEPVTRRVVAGALGAFGVVLMLAAPDTRAGLGLLVLAVAIEVVGILLDRRG
jgi:drug/metabolite transporter (DMT)-like permease